MEVLLKLFEVVFPVFFVVGIGYYLGKKNPKIDTDFITNFAANIGTPGLIFFSITSTGVTFKLFSSYFVYAFIAILGFSLVGLIFLLILKKDLVTELPPFILPNTGNMGLPICLFAYGAKGFGVASAVAAIIMLLHFTVGVFLAKKKFDANLIFKTPAFYAILFSVGFLYSFRSLIEVSISSSLTIASAIKSALILCVILYFFIKEILLHQIQIDIKHYHLYLHQQLQILEYR